MATPSRRPEGDEVLSTSSLSMDRGGHYPPAALTQTTSGGVSVMGSRDGAGPLGCADGGEPVVSAGAGAETPYRAPPLARRGLGGESETGGAPTRRGGGELRCPMIGRGMELGGGTAVGVSRGGDHVGATLGGVGGQRALSWLGPSRSGDRVTGDRATRGARGGAADAAPGARGGATRLVRAWLSRARAVGALVVSAPCALGVAAAVTPQYGRPGAARRPRAFSAAP
jgi:hypothetical protein